LKQTEPLHRTTTVLNKVIKHLSLFAFLLVPFFGIGQDFPMTDGTVNTCSGVFTDDGAGGSYAPGQSYTFTICPDNPDDVISVEFVAFSLYQSPNPNNSDYLSIYDGDNTGEATLGNYTGNALQGLPVTATVVNSTGCLTFTFSSNPNAQGDWPGWEAIISCTTPCDNPTSASEITDPAPQGPEQSIGVCLNEPITFSDVGSSAASGFTLENWVWNFDDGTIDTLEAADPITHSFTEPGEYIVTLAVIDDNGCRSLNVEPLQILVSTIPIFNTQFESPVCLGENVTIDGDPIQSVTWTALPPQVVAGETYLADGAGFSYSSTLTFDFFEPGAVLETCDDFLDVFVNMEHSYLGDLGFSLTCPDGTTVNMLTFATNSGGNTYLGEPVDDGFGETLDQGTGYDYGWSPTSTNGAIWDDANATNTNFTNNAGFDDTNDIVNPGIYESEEDLCQFEGCPLNGDWTFSVSDNLGIDNGYIFEWGINFNPELFPDVTTFTPVIGLQSDSTFWEGPNIVNVSDDGNTIQTSYDNPGFYDYTFYATNNFACTFDTTVTIEAIEGPEITAGPDLTYCEDPVQLQAGLAGADGECQDAAGNYTYCYENSDDLIVTYCPDNPGDGVTFMEFVINSGTTETCCDEFYVYDGDDITAPLIDGPLVGDLSGLSFGATNPSGCITFQIDPDGSVSCASGAQEELNISVSCLGGGNLIWSWSPTEGLTNPNIQNPFAEVEQATLYTVTAYPAGFPGCLITDQVLVSPDAEADPGIDNDSTLCYNSPTSLLTSYLNGNPAPGGTWVDQAGNAVDPQFNPTQYPDGANFNLTYTVTNGTCENSSNLILNILPATNLSCCQTNALAGPDDVACSLIYELQAQPPVGTGEWSGPPEVTFSDINDPNATATCTSPGGSMTLTWTDFNGFQCSESDDVTIQFSDSISVMAVPEDTRCYNECSGTAVAIASGGTAPGGSYFFDWGESGVPGAVTHLRDSLCTGTHVVRVTDNFGCTDSTFFTIGQPEAQEIFLTQSPPLCADSCNGEIIVDSPGAVEYSFDGGNNFQSSNSAAVCEGEHVVIARNAAGCDIEQTVVLNDPPPYQAAFNINPNPTTTKNTRITFQDVSRPGPVAKSEYTFGNNPVLGEGDSRISIFTFPKDSAGMYPITLISTSENGCVDSLTQLLTIDPDLQWYVPNSFSPNEDGINDIWKPIGDTHDLDDFRLNIFNRWGEEMFSTNDYSKGWNGTETGSGYYVDAGVYTYLIKFSSRTTEEKYEITGFITVIR